MPQANISSGTAIANRRTLSRPRKAGELGAAEVVEIEALLDDGAHAAGRSPVGSLDHAPDGHVQQPDDKDAAAGRPGAA